MHCRVGLLSFYFVRLVSVLDKRAVSDLVEVLRAWYFGKVG